jgi:phosphoglycerol transferase
MTLQKSSLHLQLLFAGIAALFIIQFIRVTGLYPTVFADEWAYSKMARLDPLQDASVPSYLYLWVYRQTSLCGDQFLSCVRVFNLLFWMLTALLIMGISRMYASSGPSAWIAFLAVASCASSLAAYFMPESMYFAAFWCLCWLCLVFKFARWHWYALVVGVWIGIMTAIKVHALFLLPAVLAFQSVRILIEVKERRWTTIALNAILLVTAALGTKFLIGYAAAGRRGLSLLGSLYGSQAGSALSIERITELISNATINAWGHGLALLALFALPIVVVAFQLLSYKNFDLTRRPIFLLSLWTFLVLGSLIVVTAAFTATVSGTGPYESIGRLHMRYYSFAFPLLLIVASTQLDKPGIQSVLGLIVVTLCCAGALYTFGPGTWPVKYVPTFVDSAELRGLTGQPILYWLLGGVGLFAALIWVYRPRSGGQIFLWLFMPLMVVLGNYQINLDQNPRKEPDVYDKAGIFIRQFLGKDREDLLVITPNPAAGLRTLFHIDSASTAISTVGANEVLDLVGLAKQKPWILLIGDYNFERSFAPYIIRLDGFTLLRIPRKELIDFRKGVWPGIINDHSGIGLAEPWGTWSTADTVKFVLSKPLPERFKLRIVGRAFGPNIRQPIAVLVNGQQAGQFQLEQDNSEITVTGTASEKSYTLEFRIPAPTAPVTVNQGADQRTLGIGLVEMEISTR